MKFIKYEDLLNETYTVFFEVIEFINKITNNLQKIDKVKLKTALRTTSFELLKNKEKEKGFSEAITSREDKNKKISFFHLGPKNDWRALLKHDLKIQLEKNFEKELKELSYIQF